MTDILEYVLLPRSHQLEEIFESNDAEAFRRFLEAAGGKQLAPPVPIVFPFPQFPYVYEGPYPVSPHPSLPKPGPDDPLDPTRRSLALAFDTPADRQAMNAYLRQIFPNDPHLLIGANIPFEGAEHWCPSDASEAIFGTRAEAGRLLGLGELAVEGALGHDVNVVIVDDGVDKSLLPPGAWGGGWHLLNSPPPGLPSAKRHGVMVARNVLAAAPQARIFDAPVLPREIEDLPSFLSQAQALYHQALQDIAAWRSAGTFTGTWVFVNAWAIYSRDSEFPAGDYTGRLGHPFNRLMRHLSGRGFDVVFAAGNCGQFCPKQRCGPYDRGPGRSILGANSHKRVLTAGAVRTDTMWLGYSSQGPGQPTLGERKPDLCAPSQFSEDDSRLANTGTSAACGLTAGVVTALRQHWGPNSLPPSDLRSHLRLTARRLGGPAWDGRLGNGVLDAAAAWRAADALYPKGP